MNDANLLIVEDEKAIAQLLVTILHKEGFTSVDIAHTAEDALQLCQGKCYQLILLDIMLPGASGLDICPFIRQTTDAPILFLTAKSSDLDVLTGFAVGGDDYIKKPFNPLEVVARIRVQLRRYMQAKANETPTLLQNKTHYQFGKFEVDEQKGSLIVNGEDVHCPALVFQLLLFMCKHPNRIFSKSELYESVWGGSMLNDDNTVMVHIHRIRERIEDDPANPTIIVNVRGLGYKFIPPRSIGG